MDDAKMRKLEEAVKAACVAILGAGADHVQIFTGFHSPSNIASEDETTSYTYGMGNFHARFGCVFEWTEKRRAEFKIPD